MASQRHLRLRDLHLAATSSSKQTLPSAGRAADDDLVAKDSPLLGPWKASPRCPCRECANFNSAQRQFLEHLRNTPEVTVIHGPFVTGKTTVCIATSTLCLSKPTTQNEAKNQVLYTVENNQAVDDVAMRLHSTIKTAGLKLIQKLTILMPAKKTSTMSLVILMI